MKKLEHENLVSLHEVIDDEDDDQLFMILEFVEGGNLLDWNEDERCFYSTHFQCVHFLPLPRTCFFSLFLLRCPMLAEKTGCAAPGAHKLAVRHFRFFPFLPSFLSSSLLPCVRACALANSGGKKGLYDEAHAAQCVTDILHGLEYLHMHHIAHRDLKPENVHAPPFAPFLLFLPSPPLLAFLLVLLLFHLPPFALVS